MTFTLDPEFTAALPAASGDRPPPSPAVGDWRAIRDTVTAAYTVLGGQMPARPEITRTDYTATSADGGVVGLRWYTSRQVRPGPAVVHAHGGGMIAGSVGLFDRWIAGYVGDSGVPFLSVDYRLAPQAQGTALAEDVYAGLAWLAEHAAELGVQPDRVALMGESAGGGLAAGAAILARGQNMSVARQILIYPMLDDRTSEPDPELKPVASWPYTSNETGWRSLLGAQYGTDGVSPVAAPARLADATGLPPAYIEVGELDIFRDEDIAYASALWRAGVSAELHVRPGLVHGFDHFAPDAAPTRRSADDRIRVIQTL